MDKTTSAAMLVTCEATELRAPCVHLIIQHDNDCVEKLLLIKRSVNHLWCCYSDGDSGFKKQMCTVEPKTQESYLIHVADCGKNTQADKYMERGG